MGQPPMAAAHPATVALIFKLTPSHGTWKEIVIHPFGLGKDGSYPNYELTIDKAGNFYGTAPAGGSGGAGIVFEYGN